MSLKRVSKKDEKRIIEMRERIISVLSSDIKLVSLTYYPDAFGSIVVELDAPAEKHSFVADRGEIYHKFKRTEEDCWHSSSCMNFEDEDIFSNLLQIIKTELHL